MKNERRFGETCRLFLTHLQQAKASPNSRAATELWKRLFGDAAEDEITEEQLQVWKEAVVAAEAATEAPARAPVASPAAREQLAAFVRETNLRTNHRSMTTTMMSAAPINNPFATTPTPAPVEDLRVPVRMGDPNSSMVHLAQ